MFSICGESEFENAPATLGCGRFCPGIHELEQSSVDPRFPFGFLVDANRFIGTIPGKRTLGRLEEETVLGQPTVGIQHRLVNGFRLRFSGSGWRVMPREYQAIVSHDRIPLGSIGMRRQKH